MTVSFETLIHFVTSSAISSAGRAAASELFVRLICSQSSGGLRRRGPAQSGARAKTGFLRIRMCLSAIPLSLPPPCVVKVGRVEAWGADCEIVSQIIFIVRVISVSESSFFFFFFNAGIKPNSKLP